MNDAREIASVVQRYFGIIKIPHDEPVKKFLAQCESKSVKLNNKNYQYYLQGQGPTIVLIHGLHSNLGSMLPIAEDLIALGYQIVLFDAPAHGEAAGINTNPLQVREFILEINKQLGELHAIICHSLGGVWALSAWNNDFHAKTLISIASPSNHKFLVEKFVELNQLRNEIAEGLVKQLERRFGETLWDEFSPAEIVKNIDVQGLIIHGKNDEFVPPEHAGQIHANWDKARLEMVEDVGHFEIAGVPKVRALITNYLREF